MIITTLNYVIRGSCNGYIYATRVNPFTLDIFPFVSIYVSRMSSKASCFAADAAAA